MRFISLVVVIIVLAAIAQSFLPWWSCIIVAGLASMLFDLSTFKHFSAGFLAIFLLWGAYAGYLNYANEGILSEKVGLLLGGLSGSMLVFVTGFLGGVFGGIGALTASLGLNIAREKK